jgi:hypothetical protein
MYLRQTTRRKDGKVDRYWRLVRSMRVGRRVRRWRSLASWMSGAGWEARALARHLIGTPE